MNGTERRTLISPGTMHCSYILQYVKGTSQAEATLNSEKLKLVALVVIELCLSQDISQFRFYAVLFKLADSAYQLFPIRDLPCRHFYVGRRFAVFKSLDKRILNVLAHSKEQFSTC